ncbi:trimeric intracellular cation channel type B isoform X3 [Denticeps clupeoides]|uniref:trimeric intracellular cation channel type B isoform X3 n=1 Tax=Denticeps clupeoides TaxID=299321 RepID=UPI0010A2EC9B|nr:trimeric intracellular cation channel type B isoform X3 [Denticeps clupeoides]
MDLLTLLPFEELSLGLSNLRMFPFFDVAHYVVSVMALREQPGSMDVAQRSPFACWFSSMLYCFGGAILSGLMMAEPPVAPLSNGTNILLASLVWYLVFYCPQDALYSCAAFLPVRLVLTGMKEVTRTWKVLGGVLQAQKKYKDGLLVMVAVGWAKGAGGGLMSNFEQLVRGIWKPETNELLKMSYPTKITLIGAVLFALQQNHYLPLQKHHLMLIYTVFIVVNKTRMMLTGSNSSPFAPVESAMYHTLFARPSKDSSLTCGTKATTKPTASAASAIDGKADGNSRNGSTAGGLECSCNGLNGSTHEPSAHEESSADQAEPKDTSNKKTD